MTKKANNGGKFALGAAVAAAAGYVAGILTAPKSGKDTRADIQRAAVKARSEAEHKLKALHSELNDLLGQGKEGAAKVQDSAKKQYETALKAAMTAKDKAREMLSAIHEGDAEDKDLQKAIDEVTSAISHLKSFATKDPDTKKK